MVTSETKTEWGVLQTTFEALFHECPVSPEQRRKWLYGDWNLPVEESNKDSL